MKIFLKLISILVSLVLSFTAVPQPVLPPASVLTIPQSGKTLTGASSQSGMATPLAQEISNNAAFAAIVTVPPVIRVANAGYGLDNQALTPADSSTIQTQLINYSARVMQSYNTTISVTVPAGATAPVLIATTQGAGSVNITAISLSGNPYSWKVTGGTAVVGNYIDYTITYNLNGRQYTQKAASYVDYVELAAGWQTYVMRKNFSNVTHTRHEYTSTLSGSCSTGAGYAVYGNGGTGYYKMLTGGGSSGFVTNPETYSGMKLWNPGFDEKENCSVWYCGQPGKKPGTNDDNIDGGHRANLDVYYDPSVVTNISQLGIKLLYWRSTSPEKISELAQDKMIYLQGNSLFSNDDASNSTAQSYFYSTNAQNNRTQSITTDPGTMTFNFASSALPPDGQKVTYASAIYGNFQQQVYLTTWNAWLITFHVMNKTALRSLIAAEDSAFRQIHDGYTDTSGAFTAYLNQLAKSKAVLNQPNASAAQISAAVNDLNNAKNNFTYASADYTALNSMVTSIYNPSLGFRPSITNDPDYYFAGVNYYPSNYYDDTSGLEATLAGITYGLDVRYQTYVNTTLAEINTVWRTLVLLNADYTTVNYYLSTIEGLNDFNGSPAGNYILANAAKYPQYASQKIYWRHFTQSSYNDWDIAVNEATLGLKVPDQAAVAAMGTALESAYDNLTIQPADYTELNAVMANTFTAIDKTTYVQNPEGVGHSITYYSVVSISVMQAKYNEIVDGLDGLLMPEQGTIITWADDLRDLYNAKILNNADYLYANVQKTTPAAYEADASVYYTTDSWQLLNDARGAVVPGKRTDEQSVVNEWAVNIYNARNALILNPADYSAVDVAILAAGLLTPANYQNWSAVAQAIDAVVYGLDLTQQNAVDGYAEAITTAIENLIYFDADYSAVDAAILAAGLLMPANYQNWSAVADAIEAVVLGLDITQQSTVDGYAETIEMAIENLIYLDADYSAVDAAILAAGLLTPTNYQNWSAVAQAIDAVVYGLDLTQQNAVDGYAEAITTAIENLIYFDADYSAVDAAILAASLLTPANYQNWSEVSNAIEAVVYGLAIIQQSIVNGYAEAITTAIENLIYFDADYSAVDAAITAAGLLVPINYQNWSAVADAIGAVVLGLDITQQSAVDGYAEAITTAIENLVYLDADYSAVNAAIIAADLLIPANYQNWSAVADAIGAVVLGLDTTQQSTVDGFAEAITTAIENLVYLDADLTALNAAIDASAAYIEDVYTPDSWAAFADALAAGIAIRDAFPAYNFTQQSTVDAAAAEIGAAAEQLVEAFVGIEVNPTGSAVVEEETGYIYGLPASGDLYDLPGQGYIDIIGNGHFVYTTSSDCLGTGTKVVLVRDADSKVMAVYTIIIFGDIDGDGLADGRDACIADMLVCGMLTQNDVGDAAYFAADANHDGSIDSDDVLLLQQAGLFLAQIDQV